MFLATIGGIAVAIGLVIEEMADILNERFLGGYKPHSALRLFGWWMLMFGICIEIADAGWTAHEIRQADPNMRSISDISAIVDIKVKANTPHEIPILTTSRVAGIMMCETNIIFTNEVFGIGVLNFLDADKFDRYFNGPTLDYVMRFHFSDYGVILMGDKNIKTAGWAFDHVKFLDIQLEFLPHDAEILGGSAVLTINSGPQKWFEIRPQKDSYPTGGTPGTPYTIIASVPTNIVSETKQ